MYTIKYDSAEARRLCGKAWKEDQICCVSGCMTKATKLRVTKYYSLYPLCSKSIHLPRPLCTY